MMKKFVSAVIKLSLVALFRNFPGLLASSVRIITAEAVVPKLQTIQGGFFEGLNLHTLVWNSSDRASILVGAYEAEVQEWLAAHVAPAKRHLLNIGAGDGLYAVGLLDRRLAAKAFCFESDKKSQDSIILNAGLNNIPDQAIQVFGTFERLQDHLEEELHGFKYINSIFIIDAEGAEFEILTDDFVNRFSKSFGIIEIHDWEGGRAKTLRARLEEHFIVDELVTGPRNPANYPLIAGESDDLRWSVMSEGRTGPGIWFCLRPTQ